MITECREKNLTRKLYEETFDDSREFVDYYYKEKCKDNRIIVSVEKGEVISMLHLNPYMVNLCGTAVKSYYVVAVATKAERRHEGQMARVFEKAFDILKSEHVPFVFLMPVDEAIYSWMGFEKICDFSADRILDYGNIEKAYDIYCIRDENYIRRMKMENMLSEPENDDLPENPVIMAKITDLAAFSSVAARSFANEKEALSWMKKKRTYICEEV